MNFKKSETIQIDQEEPDDSTTIEKSFTDTEWTWLPEILVDESILDSLPKNLEWENSFETIDWEFGDLSLVSVSYAVDNDYLPESINLEIPFYAQAPDGNRDLPRKEACEESSITLAAYYLNDKELSIEKFKEEVLSIVDLENEMFGKYIDTSVSETKEVFDEFYGIWESKIIDDPTIDELKYELSQGHPIVAPFAWKLLWNSNFTSWWPRYHMLVIKWFDDTYFYTNDVWTKFWKDFPYTYDTIMNSMHDLVPEGEWDIITWARRVLVLSK